MALMNLRQVYRPLLVAGSVLLAGGVFLFTQNMIKRVVQQGGDPLAGLARLLCPRGSSPAARSSELEAIVMEVGENVDFPFVITDTLGTPRAWHLLDVQTILV